MLTFFDQPAGSVIPGKLQIALLGWLWSGLGNGKNTAEMLKKYETDKEMAAAVDEIADEARDLKDLVARVRQKAEVFSYDVK